MSISRYGVSAAFGMADEWEDLKVREDKVQQHLIRRSSSKEDKATLKHLRGRTMQARQAVVDRAIELSLVCFVCGHHVRQAEHDSNCAVGKR